MAVRVAPLALVVVLALPALASEPPAEQSVTVIGPGTEQRIQPIAPAGEQHVDAINPDEAQRISEGSQGRLRRGVDAVSKVFVVIAGTALAVGTTLATLLFL